MEVDEEIEGVLSSQFDALNTRDRNDIIAEFRRLVGPNAATVNEAGCAFWLDMFNWNIHSAVGAFFDWQAPAFHQDEKFNMSLCQDFTFADGESVSPNTSFQKRWRLKNSGESAWLPGTSLRFLGGGIPMGDRDRFLVESLQPGQVFDLVVSLVSPSSLGQYQGQWRMSTPTGIFFGEIIWIVIQVEEGGIMGVTQGMKHLTHDRTQPHPSSSSLHWLRSEEEMRSPPAEISSFSDVILSPSVASTSTTMSGIGGGNPFEFLPPAPSAQTASFETNHFFHDSSSTKLFASSPSSSFLSSEPSPPPPISPNSLCSSHSSVANSMMGQSSPGFTELSPSPALPSFSPLSVSPATTPDCHGADAQPLLNPSSCFLAPPLVIPPSPPPYLSPTPSVGGFIVTPKPQQQQQQNLDALETPSSRCISMIDDEF